jgi:60 kDa SS-A/Ro ribonucleoprotein
MDALRSVSTRRTPQSKPAGGATVKNAAGGHVFGLDNLARLRRFLVLGSEGGTYYTKAPELTRQNADIVIQMAQNDSTALVDAIVEISVAGRAPRQNPAIFALAIAASFGNDAGRAYALSQLEKVCRTGTHLFLFATYVEQFRGWGRGLKRAVGQWYVNKPVDKLAYQVLKYRQREGWTHRDLLRLAHRNPGSPEREMLLRYVTKRDKGGVEYELLPALVDDFQLAQATTSTGTWVDLIGRGNGLSWEMLPDAALTVPEVWEALIGKGLPQTALLRQLPRLTKLGLTTGSVGSVIAAQLQDVERLKKGRVHPINVLVAQRTYASGRSARGDGTWTPTPKITDALDAAFYNAYGAVEPSGKRVLLACDVSGSMSSSVSGLPLTCREAVAALSLVTLNVEQDADVIGFSDGTQQNNYSWGMSSNSVAARLDISPRRRLDDVCRYMAALGFGRTDCAIPMVWAMKNKLDFDSIVTLTDNETWFGHVHPWQALKAYREQVGHDVKYTVVSMTATGTSIADPNDPSNMDIAGFDSTVPQVLSDFAAGRI